MERGAMPATISRARDQKKWSSNIILDIGGPLRLSGAISQATSSDLMRPRANTSVKQPKSNLSLEDCEASCD